MNPKRGIVYKDSDGSITLLTLDPPRKRVFPADDAHYGNLDPCKADVVEVEDDNETIQTVNLRAVCGITMHCGDSLCPAHLGINHALENDVPSLLQMMAGAKCPDAPPPAGS